MTVEIRIKRCLLRDRRKAAGLTQVQLAKLIGISSTRISEYERGVITNMYLFTALKLAYILKCDINDIFIFDISRK